MKKVLLIEHIHPVGIERLKKESDVEVSICISLSKLYEEIAGVEAIIDIIFGEPFDPVKRSSVGTAHAFEPLPVKRSNIYHFSPPRPF